MASERLYLHSNTSPRRKSSINSSVLGESGLVLMFKKQKTKKGETKDENPCSSYRPSSCHICWTRHWCMLFRTNPSPVSCGRKPRWAQAQQG